MGAEVVHDPLLMWAQFCACSNIWVCWPDLGSSTGMFGSRAGALWQLLSLGTQVLPRSWLLVGIPVGHWGSLETGVQTDVFHILSSIVTVQEEGQDVTQRCWHLWWAGWGSSWYPHHWHWYWRDAGKVKARKFISWDNLISEETKIPYQSQTPGHAEEVSSCCKCFQEGIPAAGQDPCGQWWASSLLFILTMSSSAGFIYF